jgi:predicted flap endonuclease-1-like 5' DNA nuclease
MSLLDSIKSLLGLDREERTPSGESRVTVEREPGGRSEPDPEPATAGEDAIKGTDTAADSADPESEPATPAPTENGEPEPTPAIRRASAADTDASASTGTMVDTEAGIEPAEAVAEADTDTGPAAEPAEAAGPVAGEPDADPDPEPEPDPAALEDATEELDDAAGGEPVDAIKGIGSAYAERLAEAGVETVGDLVNADPEALAEATGVSETRIERWADRARQRLE